MFLLICFSLLTPSGFGMTRSFCFMRRGLMAPANLFVLSCRARWFPLDPCHSDRREESHYLTTIF